MKSENNVLSCFGGLFVVIAAVIAGTIFNGITLMHLWAWFVAIPLGVKVLTFWQALGFALIVSYLTFHDVDVESPKRSTSEAFSKLFASTVLRPLFVLLIGYIIFRLAY